MKLIVLASIYSLTAEQMLGLCPSVGSPSILSEEIVPNATLITDGPLEGSAKVLLPDSLLTNAPPEATALFPSTDNALPSHYRRGIIGLRDRTLEPMIRAGSVVLIDTQKRTIVGRRDWNHEFDRPIYFLLTRDGYLAGFCEIDRETDWLTVVPHALSFESNRRWRFRKEIEVVGTVVAVAGRRVT